MPRPAPLGRPPGLAVSLRNSPTACVSCCPGSGAGRTERQPVTGQADPSGALWQPATRSAGPDRSRSHHGLWSRRELHAAPAHPPAAGTRNPRGRCGLPRPLAGPPGLHPAAAPTSRAAGEPRPCPRPPLRLLAARGGLVCSSHRDASGEEVQQRPVRSSSPHRSLGPCLTAWGGARGCCCPWVIGGISKGNVSLCTAIVADLGSPSARSKGMSSGWPFLWASLWAPHWEPSCPRRQCPGWPCSSPSPTCCSSGASCQRRCPQRSGRPPSPWGSGPPRTCSAPWPCSASPPWRGAQTRPLESVRSRPWGVGLGGSLRPPWGLHARQGHCPSSPPPRAWQPARPGPGLLPLPLPVLRPGVHAQLPGAPAFPVQQGRTGEDVFLHRSHHGHHPGRLRPADPPWQGNRGCEAGHLAAHPRFPLRRLGTHAAHPGLGAAPLLLGRSRRGPLPVLRGRRLWLARAEGHGHGHAAELGRPGQGRGARGGRLSVLAGRRPCLLHRVRGALPAPLLHPADPEPPGADTQGRVAGPPACDD
ncbi:major facilitator superfamily domain-containing protein 10 isoform X4 [Bos indicus]|uniref:Major facilitator superfamily domain-containing protein 10 isoform X4 n=1 Tax=Bos indicus TaxID=9915 RepID=A0ABM4SGY8_BOSIN